jgi:hypothetical protein
MFLKKKKSLSDDNETHCKMLTDTAFPLSLVSWFEIVNGKASISAGSSMSAN